jgi:hypothetical protein
MAQGTVVTDVGFRHAAALAGDTAVVPAHATFGGNVALTQFNAGNSGTALTIDWNNGNNQRVTLTGACTFTFTNPKPGAVYTLELVQDGSGSRTVTWPAAVLWPGGTTPTLTTTLNRADMFTLYYDAVPGTPKYLGQTFGLNFAV